MATAPTVVLIGATGATPARAPMVSAASAATLTPPAFPIDLTAPVPRPATEPERVPVEPPQRQSGEAVEASYYGQDFAGRRTANGERFDPSLLTAAHRTLPFGTLVRVTDSLTGKSVVVRINDRGPFHGNRALDLSEAAARQIGLAERGTGTVLMEVMRA